MKRRRALLKYDDAPPSACVLEVSVYLADEVDAVLKQQANAARSDMTDRPIPDSMSKMDLCDEVDRLRANLTLAEEGLANATQEHQQYVDWASPQLERLGREMVENERMRAALVKITKHRLHGRKTQGALLAEEALRPAEPQDGKQGS